LTGRYPFPDGSAAEKMMAHQLKQPEAIQNLSPDVPADLVEVVERLMQKNPDKRYGSAAEVAETLRPFAPKPTAVAGSFLRTTAARRDRGADPVRTSRLPGTETPRPSATRQAAAFPSLPGREKKTIPPPEEPASPEPVTVAEVQPHHFRGMFEEPRRSWEERLGPLGIAVGAIVVCLLAWLLTWQLFQ
jgi:serine/threonine-protein kinase